MRILSDDEFKVEIASYVFDGGMSTIRELVDNDREATNELSESDWVGVYEYVCNIDIDILNDKYGFLLDDKNDDFDEKEYDEDDEDTFEYDDDDNDDYDY